MTGAASNHPPATDHAVLVVMSGLPGVGKSAIADALGRELTAVVISVDEIEAAMLRSGIAHSFETGLAAYNVGAALAAHQLRLGFSVIADAANYLEVGRQIWWSAGAAAGVEVHGIEVVCSDESVHQARLANRRRDLEPFPEPTWPQAAQRREETEPWSRPRLVLDSVQSVEASVRLALDFVRH